MFIRSGIVSLLSIGLLIAGCGEKDTPPSPGPEQKTFSNPIMSGSDPWIIKQGATYYYTHTVGNRVVLWKNNKVTTMASAASTVVFNPPAGSAYTSNVWAPELHYLDNKWYLYITAGSGPDETQRTWVLENPATDPTTGQWTMKGRIFAGDTDFWAIDGTVLEYKEKRYFLWSGRPDQSVQNQNIYIAEMDTPWSLTGNSVELTKPELSWERAGGPVNEAPQVLKNANGQVFMVYSASGCWTDDYALGMLTLKPDGNPLNAADWTKNNVPVFSKSSTGRAFGPGHCAFFKSVEGDENWIIYHANNNSNDGCGEKRNVRIQPFVFTANGTPQFGVPAPISAAIGVPSGE
ncbi:glycoside hydrolase family 43 protein [Flavihumibacter sp. CACIAM 22H1]|uniref:glycoside hydrolase family 43 protein n=1 Tax=Flavihumibacter sp. CACIAM 22H1 TaxID=1812911 RepID=UPI0007A86BEB|nr:glycoside hydrolase family 43 protein [Flavihumibacter sp. CACIAM 22H1]KYP15257.1 MAG: glycosyl hydrolase family 43 [Flavihumibacter sp. CACIAM 22H1]